MKHLTLVILALLIVACDPIAPKPEPSATDINPVFQTATPQRSTSIAQGTAIEPTSALYDDATRAAATRAYLDPTRTAAAAIASPMPDGFACVWIPRYKNLKVRSCPAARCEILVTLENDIIRTTGEYVYEHWEDFSYVHVDIAGAFRVDGWAEWRYFPSPPASYVDLWTPSDDCVIPATPTPDAPTSETWKALTNVNIRPQCSTADARIGLVEAGKTVRTKPEGFTDATNIEWRMLADTPGCVAVRSGATRLMERQ